MKVRKFRLLRLKHGVSLKELGTEAGLSKQRISELELGDVSITKVVEDKIVDAFASIVVKRSREISFFELDYLKNRDSLFELVEGTYEL